MSAIAGKARAVCLQRDSNFGITCIRAHPNEAPKWCAECVDRRIANTGESPEMPDHRLAEIVHAFSCKRSGKTLAQELVNEIMRQRVELSRLKNDRDNLRNEDIRLRAELRGRELST